MSAMNGESGYARIQHDAYHTLDSDWIVPSLLDAIPITAPVLEPCAGRGHLVRALREADIDTVGQELHIHPDHVVPDIETGRDVFDLQPDDLAPYRWIVSNLPYDQQDAIVEHLLDVSAVHGTNLALLVRAEWPIAQRRRAMVHAHSAFDSIVYLTRRPRWIPPEESNASPRHNFAWVVWRWDRPNIPPSVFFRP